MHLTTYRLMIVLLVLGLATTLMSTTSVRAIAPTEKFVEIYSSEFHPNPYPQSGIVAQGTYDIMRQGNDSNCDFIALRNGIQNIGGSGNTAYWEARTLITQSPRDYHEGFYTLQGPNGSDKPFSIDNLGAAPEAFVGVYQALGYNATLLATSPNTVDMAFTQTIVDRLLSNPYGTFAHLWITPRSYDARARTIWVPETGEAVSMLYPYHEVVAFIDPSTPEEVIILDGLVGYPFTISIDRLAFWMRGFNKVLVVSREDGQLIDHQRYEIQERGRPYVANRLGGAYLRAARAAFGPSYTLWGEALGQPLRWQDEHGLKVVLPGKYIHYERIDEGPVTMSLLGVRMGLDLEAAEILAPRTIRPWEERQLVNGIRQWVITTFGSEQQFQEVFGNVLTDEVWISQAQMQQSVLRNQPHDIVHQSPGDGFIVVLAERAMIAWSPQHGTFLLPLGQIYDTELQRAIAN